MRYVNFLSIVLGIALVLSGCGQKAIETTSTKSEVQAANLQTVSFQVDGFTWVSCAITVESAVTNLDGVQSAKVKGSGETIVTFDPSKISMDDIEKVITKLGYEVKNKEK